MESLHLDEDFIAGAIDRIVSILFQLGVFLFNFNFILKHNVILDTLFYLLLLETRDVFLDSYSAFQHSTIILLQVLSSIY